MPTHHATLGPSGASRWLQCPASIGMAQKVPKQESSPHAQEGTIAHELGEIRAGRYFGLITEEEFQKKFSAWKRDFNKHYGDDAPRAAEMHHHIDGYISLIEERAALHKGSSIALEQRLETGVPGSWGTSDVVIVSPEHVEIIDLKYGTGVPVDAEWNPQLMLYGVGALDAYGDLLGDTEVVYATVYQPRIGNTSTFEISPVDLRAWRDWHVIPLAEEALGEDARFGPSATACRWCPAAGICKPRADKNLAADFGDESDYSVISPERLADILRKAPEWKAWLTAVENSALDRAYSSGEKIPGYKVVLSGGRRILEDAPAAIQALIDSGYPAEKVATFKAKGFGELENLVGGKKILHDILGDLIGKSEGKPSLVVESDKREPITPESSAADDFK